LPYNIGGVGKGSGHKAQVDIVELGVLGVDPFVLGVINNEMEIRGNTESG